MTSGIINKQTMSTNMKNLLRNMNFEWIVHDHMGPVAVATITRSLVIKARMAYRKPASQMVAMIMPLCRILKPADVS